MRRGMVEGFANHLPSSVGKKGTWLSFDISIRVAPETVEDDPEYFEVGNYTYNCNPMVAHALNTVTAASANAGDGSIAEIMGFAGGPRHQGSGLFKFHDAPCVEAAGLLNIIIAEMRAFPDTYRAMNPENGWGDYDSFLCYLCELYEACIEHPTGRIKIS